MKKYIGKLAAVSAGVLLALTGCDVKFDPTESGLYIDKDGSVVSAEITSFDNSAFEETRYDEAELTTFVEDAVKEYNGTENAYASDDKDHSLTVSIEKLTVKNDTATLLLDYLTCADYLAFNESDDTVTALTCADAPEAVEAGVSLDGLVDSSGAAVDTSSMKEDEDICVVTISGETNLTVNGKIQAVSEGVTVVDTHTVSVSGEDAVVVFK